MEEEETESCYFPKRYLMVALLFLLVTYDICTRRVMLAASELIVEHTHPDHGVRNITGRCAVSADHQIMEKYQDRRGNAYKWTEDTTVQVPRFFFCGFILIQPVSGYISDRYGSKYHVSFAVSATSVLILISPTLMDSTNGNIAVLKVMRFFQGCFSGILQSASGTAMAHWIPEKERARLSSLVFLGMNIGFVGHRVLTFHLIRTKKDWTAPCYIYGGVGIGLSLLCLAIASNNPDECPGITEKERKFLSVQMAGRVDHGRKRVPLLQIFISGDVWAIFAGSVGHIFFSYFSEFFLEMYMMEILLMDRVKSNIWSTVLPYCLMSVVSVTASVFSDWAINKKIVNKEALRKFFTCVGTMGAPIYMVAGSFAMCEGTLAKMLFLISMALKSCIIAGVRLVLYDLSPNYAGLLTGITNGFSSAGGLAVKPFVNIIAPHETMMEYRNVFWIMLAVSIAGNLIFITFGRTSLKHWNTPKKY